MEFREATEADTEAIRSMAEASVTASYTSFLSAETIGDALTQWYSDEATADLVESDETTVLVAADDRPAGFSQSELVTDGKTVGHIHWLHVRPDERGAGLGSRLLTRTREALLDAGAEHILGFVLEGNEDGTRFYEEHGFERAGTRSIQIGSDTYTENVYTESDDADAEWRAIEERTLEDGTTVFVSYGEAARGSEAPFYSAYESRDETDRFGWFCGNCETLDNAMDAMGRIECNVCGNFRKPTEWDAAHE